MFHASKQGIGIMFFSKFFRSYSQTVTPIVNPLFNNFMGGGCVFTDGKHVLAGYQPYKKFPCISGIGGHKEEGETYYQTAFRETVEEIYHVNSMPSQLVPTLIRHLPPRKEDNHLNYILLNYTFEDFNKFLRICKRSGLKSPLYKKLPSTLLECIQNRDVDMKAEISHLCLLPVIPDFQGRNFVHPSFLKDMKMM
jgi:hypothetical protein